jgi:hypothetical protein
MDLGFGGYIAKTRERVLVGPDGPCALSARAFDILRTGQRSTPDWRRRWRLPPDPYAQALNQRRFSASHTGTPVLETAPIATAAQALARARAW